MANLETQDIFKGAFYLCMGSNLTGIRFGSGSEQIATFFFNGPDLHRHNQAYVNGHALVNPAQLRTTLNYLRDILFAKLREQKEPGLALRLRRDKARLRKATPWQGDYENDSKRTHRTHQIHS